MQKDYRSIVWLSGGVIRKHTVSLAKNRNCACGNPNVHIHSKTFTLVGKKLGWLICFETPHTHTHTNHTNTHTHTHTHHTCALAPCRPCFCCCVSSGKWLVVGREADGGDGEISRTNEHGHGWLEGRPSSFTEHRRAIAPPYKCPSPL